MKPLRIYLVLLPLLASCCVSSRAQDLSFPVPQVPDSLQVPGQRLAFVLERFWQDYDFCDDTQLNRQVGEQGFVDYLQLLAYADSTLAAKSVHRFVDLAFLPSAPQSVSFFSGLVEHYLQNPYSPQRNDLLLAHFLRQMAEGYDRLPPSDQTEAESSRARYLLSLVEKNQVGTVATDFEFLTRPGRRSRLYDVDAELLVLYFHNPACGECQLYMPQALQSPALQKEGLTVLLVNPEDNQEVWEDVRETVPQNWIDACSPSGAIVRQQLYYLPVTPAFYLLDRDKRVLLKNVTLRQLEDELQQ